MKMLALSARLRVASRCQMDSVPLVRLALMERAQLLVTSRRQMDSVHLVRLALTEHAGAYQYYQIAALILGAIIVASQMKIVDVVGFAQRKYMIPNSNTI